MYAVNFPGTTSDPDNISISEDTLKVLLWEGYGPDYFIKEFEEEIFRKYNRIITVKVTFVAGADYFYDPVRDKSVDLVSLSHHALKDARFGYIEKALIVPFDLEHIPNFQNIIPEFKTAEYHLYDGMVFGVPVANGPYGLGYNSDKISETPNSWEVLWDPNLVDDYSIGLHEYLYNVNITALVLGYPIESLGNYDLLNNPEFKAKLNNLALNAHTLWVGVDKPEDLIGHSAAACWGDSFSSLRLEGENWKMAQPKEGTMWWIDDFALTWSLADKPFLKIVAEEFVNKSLSSEFQIDHLIREVGIYPVITDIDDKLTQDEIDKIQSESSDVSGSHRILQSTYSIRDRNGLKMLWDEAMANRFEKRN